MKKKMKEIIKQFRELASTRDLWQVYKDFLEVVAISISNACDKDQAAEREKRYLDIIKTYSPEQIWKISDIMGLVVLELSKEPQDVLGRVFMELELGNKWTGQVFTPLNLADLLANVAFDDKEIKEKGYMTVTDPAVGGGVTIIGLVRAMLRQGLNPQKQLLVICGDLDIKAVHMTYIQLSLLGIPAIVKNQDALTLETMSIWYTPTYIWDLWRFKK
ncbi:DNA methyltransferase family protein [Peptoniphilus grossensis]|uniref:SAM-dependent DNA methyltransferase n=2 Tax=Peptoniphilus grossensis TaxID=1465756 RepID=UPI00164EC043|nr:SAM-dependent DNA methyltransferase [Peptoniphilus grossensis]